MKPFARVLFVLVIAAMGLHSPAVHAQALPNGFTSEIVIPAAAGLYGPTALAFVGTDRIFIAQKDGQVRVWQNGAMLATPFIDLSAEVNSYYDRGLMGMAVHPNFPSTPYVYLLYTYDPPTVAPDGTGARVSRLLRVTANSTNPNIASTAAGSRVILLGTNSTAANIGDPNVNNNFSAPSCQSGTAYVFDCIPSDGSSHSIGTVAFGLDGSLYVSSGDSADFDVVDRRALRTLDVDSLSGKIMRINPITGQGYSNNPFYNGDLNSNRSKVINLGLRNPFRFTIHPTTGVVYTGDVGWNTWEEINFGVGRNFGWPCYEGSDTGSAQQTAYANDSSTQARCATLYAQGTAAVQAPAAAYSHSGSGASVQAGAFYTGSIYPAQYRNALFIEDYSRDWIRYVTFDSSGKGTINNFGTDVSPNGGGPVQLVVGPDSNLYYVVLNFGTNVSEVRRIRFTGTGNTAPTANASATPTTGAVPLTVAFSSAGSFDPDGQTLTYAWNFGDGTTSTAANPSKTYGTAGTFTATLTVTDTQGAQGTSQVVISVGAAAPTVNIASPANNSSYKIGDTISYSGSATDPEDGSLSANMRWSLLIHHNEHVHSDVYTAFGPSGSFVAQDHGDDSVFLELCASATDSSGLTAQKCVALQPTKVPYTFVSDPAGFTLSYAGRTLVTPFTVNAILNAPRQIIAPAVQNGLNFTSWSDGGAASHIITIQPTGQTLTATYGTSTFLSSLTPTAVSGRFRNDLSVGGRTLRLNGTTYPRGVGVANESTLQYNLGGAYRLFTADIGVDDEATSTGSVIFRVTVDGTRIYDSGNMNGTSATKKISLNVSGRSTLRITVNGVGNAKKQAISSDWANAKLLR